MQINQGMMRALEAFQEAILMVDTTDPECWTVLHVNKTFVEQTGAASPRMLVTLSDESATSGCLMHRMTLTAFLWVNSWCGLSMS